MVKFRLAVKIPNMKEQVWLLFVGFLAGSWLSLQPVQCGYFTPWIQRTSCHKTSYGRTCFTTFFTQSHNPVRESFQSSRNWCKKVVRGSSLVVIKSEEDQQNVNDFIGKLSLANETIILDAHKLSANDSQNWSWVNGNQIIPKEIIDNGKSYPEAAAVVLHNQQGIAQYVLSNVSTIRRYLCEYSGSKPVFSYVTSHAVATWFDARKECLRSGGDLASITDLKVTEDWSWLDDNTRYWIGLHRNTRIWKTTGAALTYTNWKNGFPEDSPDKQCICISSQSMREDKAIFSNKWRTCNCDDSYVIVCQKDEKFDALTIEIVATEEIDRNTASTSSVTQSSSNDRYENQTTAFAPSPTIDEKLDALTIEIVATEEMLTEEVDSSTVSTSSMTQSSSNDLSENQTNAFAPSPITDLFKSFTVAELLFLLFIVVLLFVTVYLITFVILLVTRNRKSKRSRTKKVNAEEAVCPEYEAMAEDKIPSYETVPTCMYTELELTQQSSRTNSYISIYDYVRSTNEEVDIDTNAVYADLREV